MPDPNARSTKKYDAVLAPAQYPRGLTGPARALAVKKEFGPLLGSKLVHSRQTSDNMILMTPDTKVAHRFHPGDHPNAGEDRYDWVDRGDGVCYGLLTEASLNTDDDREQAALAARLNAEARQKEKLAARLAELDGVQEGDRTPEERAEHARLRRFVPLLGAGPKAVPPPPAPPTSGGTPQAALDRTQAPAMGPGSQPPVADSEKPGVAPGTKTS